MKTTETLNKMDDALSQLLTAHSTLEQHVESADGARAVAAMMLPTIDTLLFCHRTLVAEAENGG